MYDLNQEASPNMRIYFDIRPTVLSLLLADEGECANSLGRRIKSATIHLPRRSQRTT